jgi:hypothetical protein
VAEILHRARGLAVALGRERVAAIRYALLVLLATRASMWLVALIAEATTQPRRLPGVAQWDDPSLTLGLPQPFQAVFGVWARWDSVWFLRIAEDGYASQEGAPAFFPLYPLAMRVTGTVVGGPLVAGVLISLVASGVALYLLHRIATREIGALGARRAVLYLAVCPMALFLAAVYSEALFLALVLGSFWAARRGSFVLAGLWGGLAAATRPAGVLLVIPLALMWVDSRGGWRRALAPGLAAIALVPAGLAAYATYLWVSLGDPLMFSRVQGDVWQRRTVTPVQGLWDGLAAAWAGVRQLASGGTETIFWTRTQYDPIRAAALNLTLLAALVALALGVWLVFRTLPRAYGWWSLAMLVLPLSTPGFAHPLLSLPRFGLVVFPVFIALAAWSTRRPGVHTVVLVAFPMLLGLYLAQWATWQWVS